MHVRYIYVCMYFRVVALPDLLVVGMLQIGIRAKVSMAEPGWVSKLSLDKWSLDPRFRVEIVSGGTNFEPQNLPECQEVTLVVLRGSGGVAVS
jgi:hypothetical protein